MLKSHRYVVERSVVVNLKSGNAVAGVIVGQVGPLLILKSAALHAVGSSAPATLDGETVVHVDHVDFIQIP